MSKRRPYVRPMTGWWKKNPFYIEYMVHEGTALFVAAYALILTVGIVRLAQGEAAWNGWLSALHGTPALLFHVCALVLIGYHSYTWFKIMPRTIPPVFIGGKRVADRAITVAGLVAVVVASLVLLALAWGSAQ